MLDDVLNQLKENTDQLGQLKSEIEGIIKLNEILSTILSRSRTLSFAGITFSAKLSSFFSCTFRSHVP